MLRTPLRRSAWLSRLSGGDVVLKLEVLQPTHSYKIRGATNAVLKLAETAGAAGGPLVTASAGNHGRALAFAAAQAGMALTVYVPGNAPRTKIDAIRELGAELRFCDSYDAAEQQAKRHPDALYISPYAHPDVIAGAGTVALEILDDLPGVDTIVAAIGGGGLISGLAIAAEGRAEAAGVEVAASTPFTSGLAAGRIVEIEVGETLADGLSGNLDPDTPTFDIVRRLVPRIAVVGEDDLRLAVRGAAEHERLIVEGAAAAALAAVATRKLDVAGRRAAVVVSGANIDLGQWTQLVG